MNSFLKAAMRGTGPILRKPLPMQMQGQQGTIRTAHGHGHNNIKPVHLDEFPIPQGSWEAHYKVQNAKYTRHLLLGLGFFLFTLWHARQSPYFDFAFTPELPEDMCPPVKKPMPKCPPKE